MKHINTIEEYLNEADGKSIGDRPFEGPPLIPKGVAQLGSDPRADKYENRAAFDRALAKQQYFSASYSHCFYDLAGQEHFHKNGAKYSDKDAEESVMLFETGHEIVAVWDQKNKVGYILPSNKMKI